MLPARLLRLAATLLLIGGVYAAGYRHGQRLSAARMPPPTAWAVMTAPTTPRSACADVSHRKDHQRPSGQGQSISMGDAAPAGWSHREVFPKRPDLTATQVESLIKDPRKLPAFFSHLDAHSIQRILRNIASALVKQDPAAAWDWAVHVTDPGQRSHFEAALSSLWSCSDPATAIPWLLQNHPDKLPVDLTDALKTWMAQDRDAVLALVHSQPAGPASHKLAASYLEALIRQDPSAAVTELDLIPAGQVRNAIFGKAINRWARQNITEASSYASAMPAGPGRDTAIEEILGPAFEADPGGALAWTAYLGNAHKRELFLEAYFESWHKADPEAARLWLNKSDVEPALRRKLLEPTVR